MATAVSTDSAKRALLERLIDDAALFPPAELPMRAALRHHARLRESAYWWIAGRFVVAASRLDELASLRDQAQALELSVILDSAMSGAKGDTVLADLHRIDRVLGTAGIRVASLELRVPGAGLDQAGLARSVSEIAQRWPSDPVSFWYEPSYSAGWATPPDAALAALAAVRGTAPPNVTVGAKVRCGGQVAGATPSVDDLAAFAVAAHAHDVPWKATAGLHHPVRGAHGVSGGVVPHGFLNLFIAGAALHAGALDAARVAEVIAETEPRAFVVDPAHVGWRDVRVEAEQVGAARERCVSFGSCSFDEPVNDLRELGILT
jgi:hypothetical protein